MSTAQTFFIKTFGCQANIADSERLTTLLLARGMQPALSMTTADYVVLNSCMVRQSAENRIYGTVRNLARARRQRGKPATIAVTGCMVGAATHAHHNELAREKAWKRLRTKLPEVDLFLPFEEIGFAPVPDRSDSRHAWVPIANGCNNFCSFCIVPYTRGREVSRPFVAIRDECLHLREQGYTQITLLGQNVNSYGSDLLLKSKDNPECVYAIPSHALHNPTYVQHLGKQRIPTLFPFLLSTIAAMEFERISFVSANPWDFSEELIATIAQHNNISREIHLPLQSGDNAILRAMKRWYTAEDYLSLVHRIRTAIPEANFTTDIIVGFPGETEEAFQHTVDICNAVGFTKSYTAQYSPRPHTHAAKSLLDTISHEEKERRWRIIDQLVNKEP